MLAAHTRLAELEHLMRSCGIVQDDLKNFKTEKVGKSCRIDIARAAEGDMLGIRRLKGAGRCNIAVV